MRRFAILTLILIFAAQACRQDEGSMAPDSSLPKMLFISTGNEHGIGETPAGVVIAQRFFNSRGVMCFIQPRDILLEPEHLADFAYLILSTSAGYHDADRLYSLSFMSDTELENIRTWVEAGGVLIAGDNTGRNYLTGYDRITEFGSLDTSNWPLAEVFGLHLAENNMAGFRIMGSLYAGDTEELLAPRQSSFWTLVGDSNLGESTEVLAWWTNDSADYPAITINPFGAGNAVLLASSYFLHPANSGGFSGIADIEHFYEYILPLSPDYSDKVSLNFWPGTAHMALALTTNSMGTEEELASAAAFLNDHRIPVTVFHTPSSPSAAITQFLDGDFRTASAGFSAQNYQNLGFSAIQNEIISNEKDGGEKYKGFRFPMGKQSYWGLMALDDRSYVYDATMPVNQVEAPEGAAFPYHPPVSSRGYYKSLGLLELPVLKHDDRYFFADINMDENPVLLKKKSLLYGTYLQRCRKEVAEAYGAMLVCNLTPALSFHNDTTLHAIKGLVDSLEANETTWFCTLEELADRWIGLEQLTCYCEESDKVSEIGIKSPGGLVIDDLSFRLIKKPASVSASHGQARIKEAGGRIYLICDGVNGQQIKIRWE